MKKINLFFWEPCVSPHKTELYNFISKHSLIDNIYFLSTNYLSIDKKILNVSIEDNFNKKFKIIIYKNSNEIESILKKQNKNSLNILSGFWGNPYSNFLINFFYKNKIEIFFISETRNHYDLVSKFKFIQSWIFEYKLRKVSKKVFAIGDNAFNWFCQTGFSKKNLIKFQYYISAPNKNFLKPRIREIKSKKLKVGYIGALVFDKGLKSYTEVLKSLKFQYCFYVCGEGSDKKYFLNILKKENINFRYIKPLSYKDRYSFFQNIDLMIFNPIKRSKRNGWCATVNESLFMGIPVIVNKYVGSSILVKNDFNGYILNSDKSSELYEKICLFYEKINKFDYEKIRNEAINKTSLKMVVKFS